MAEANWFYVKSGEQLGPVSFDELRDRAVRGDLERSDLVWKDGMPDWLPAETVEGLFEGVELPPTSAPPTWRPGDADRYRPPRGGAPAAVTGFILSLLGLPLAIFCGPAVLLGVAGLILCIVGYPAAKRSGRAGFAIAGIVIGAITTLLLVIGIVAIVIALSSQ